MNSENVWRLIYHEFKSGCADYRLYKLICLLLVFFVVSLPETQGQQNTDYTIHANIIYRFTKYIEWPASKKSGPFVIGIVGDSPLYEVMKIFILNKTVGNRPIIVKKFSASSEVFNCQILFISEDESRSLKKIATLTAGNSILLVTESEGLALKGSCINFIIVDERLKLEINKSNIDQRSMSIASELLQLGIAIK
ncbi:MAG: YfiR family protein [Chitinophagaceae bacterium]